MRKFILVLFVALILTFLLCGCNSKEDVSSSTKPDSSNSESETSENKNLKMVVGKIENVAGNQITLAIGEIEGDIEMPSGGPEDFSRPDGEIPEDFSFPEGEKPEGFSVLEGSTPPNGEPPSMPNGEKPNMEDFSFPEGERPTGGNMPQFNMEDIEITYTGETEKYIIPAGVKVGTGDYTSLSKGMVVSLRLDDTDTVVSVSVMGK